MNTFWPCVRQLVGELPPSERFALSQGHALTPRWRRRIAEILIMANCGASVLTVERAAVVIARKRAA